MNTEGKLIVSVDDLLPEVCQIRVNDFSIPVRRIELLMNELMFLDETMVYKILTPQEAKQLKFEEALDALKVSLRPFQPRKEIWDCAVCIVFVLLFYLKISDSYILMTNF